MRGQGRGWGVAATVLNFKDHIHTGLPLVVQWLRLCALNAGGTGSIPGQGPKILHAVRCSKKQNYVHAMASIKTAKIYIYLFVSQLLFSVSFMCLIPFFIVYSLNICIFTDSVRASSHRVLIMLLYDLVI